MAYRLYPAAWAAVLPASEKLTLLKLVDHASDEGKNIRPSVPTIASVCGLSERTVQSALAALVKRGLIVLTKEADFGARKPREYRLDLEKLNAAGSDKGCNNFTGETTAPVQMLHPTGAITAPTGEMVAPKSSIETTNESTGADAPADPQKALFDYGKSVLGRTAGGVVSKLLRHVGNDRERTFELLSRAAGKSDPMEWVQGVLKRDAAVRSENVIAETDRFYREIGLRG